MIKFYVLKDIKVNYYLFRKRGNYKNLELNENFKYYIVKFF